MIQKYNFVPLLVLWALVIFFYGLLFGVRAETAPTAPSKDNLLNEAILAFNQQSYGLSLNGLRTLVQGDFTDPARQGQFVYITAVAHFRLLDYYPAYQTASAAWAQKTFLVLKDKEWAELMEIYALGTVRFGGAGEALPIMTAQLVKIYAGGDPSLEKRLLHEVFLAKALKNDSLGAVELYNKNNQLNPYFTYGLEEKLALVRDPAVFEQISALTSDFKLKERLALQKIQVAVDALDFNRANREWADFSNHFPTPIYTHKIDSLVREKNRLEKGTPFRIGVLMPLSEPSLRPLTDQFLQGLRLGLSDFFPPGFNWELVYRNQTGPDGILEAFKQLVEFDHVDIVLGPITKLTSEALVEPSEEYGVPVLSFSLSAEVASFHPYFAVFQRKTLLEALAAAELSVKSLCAGHQAIFYDPKMEDWADLYAQKVQAEGVALVDKVKIQTQKDLVSVFNAQTGQLYYHGSSLQLTDTTGALLKNNNGTAKPTKPSPLAKNTAKIPQAKDATPDIDLVFAPLNNQGFLVMAKFAKLYKMEDTKLLGLSSLHTKQTLLSEKDFRGRVWIADIASTDEVREDLQNKLYLSTYLLRSQDSESSYSLYAYLTPFLLSQAMLGDGNLTAGNMARNFVMPSTQSSPFGQIMTAGPSQLGVVPNLINLERGKFTLSEPSCPSPGIQLQSKLE